MKLPKAFSSSASLSLLPNSANMRVLSRFSLVRPLFAIPWTVSCQAPQITGFSWQEDWSGLPCPSAGDLPDTGIEPTSLNLLPWQAGSLPLVPPGKPNPTESHSKH